MNPTLFTAHAMNPDAIAPIRNYCQSRNGKCAGCRYSIPKVDSQYDGYAMCIFGNCPMSWEENQ